MTYISRKEKIKVLESRAKLVNEYLSVLNEAAKETFLSEKKEFDPMAAFEPDAESFEKAGGSYWQNLQNKEKPAGLLKKLGNKLSSFGKKTGTAARQASGRVDPSLDVDDPKFVAKNLGTSIKRAKSLSKDFKQSALNTTKKINTMHDAVSDVLTKFNTFAKTLPQETRGVAEREATGLVKDFYDLLSQEKDRIETYMNAVKSDLTKGGYGSLIKEEEPALTEFFFTEDHEEDYDEAMSKYMKDVLEDGDDMVYELGLSPESRAEFITKAEQLIHDDLSGITSPSFDLSKGLKKLRNNIINKHSTEEYTKLYGKDKDKWPEDVDF